MFARYAALSLLALVAAQDSSSASQTDIEIIEANFQNAELVPEFISSFSPQGILNVEYDGGSALSPGQNLSQSSVSSTPSLSILPSSNASDISGDNRYTVILADANVVGTDESTEAQTRHWLVNGASLDTSSAPWTVTYTNATSITDYAGPAPPGGSGPHRYVFMVYYQPDSFQAPANLSTANTPVSTFFVSQYVQESGLGALVAATYMQVENGTPTGTIPATTAVDTATIGQSTSSGSSGSSTSHASASGTESARASGASASGSGAAGAAKDLGWSAIVGGLGVVGAVLGAAIVV
ncbi:phosphatidylethanolamine-binding protein [Kockovaella imperatae]|uniref:Phosphatidylethanolamine-binding protein n=1 Tax=Kockovaella imperatae TaxID=4999 RepID=A0A1Y1UBX7_9TREE|nr:phosphatidylethanolamine-binding protein [Kockovaella imperatae]ORX34585.1 phosphatidylethanolamine-binding protein [Kockovaella imperatae]